MKSKKKTIEEKKSYEMFIVSKMIDLYTRMDVDSRNSLKSYVLNRIDHCPHIRTKTFCSHCSSKCYSPEMSIKIKDVMKYAGWRMLFVDPKLVFKHLMAR